MAKYVVGDIQGCFDELMELLEKVNFNEKTDHLICAGDIINRGAKSLDTINFLFNLPNCIVTLGNHDIHLLKEYYTKRLNECNDNLDEIIYAKNSAELCNWLRHQSFLYFDENTNIIVTHAGIYPKWGLDEAKTYAKEMEDGLQGSNFKNILENMYPNFTAKWSNDFTDMDRYSFLKSAFTLMRYIENNDTLKFGIKCNPKDAPSECTPWFKVENKKLIDLKVVFGHWSSLRGVTNSNQYICLDTGCVWGGGLTIINMETLEKTTVNSKAP